MNELSVIGRGSEADCSFSFSAAAQRSMSGQNLLNIGLHQTHQVYDQLYEGLDFPGRGNARQVVALSHDTTNHLGSADVRQNRATLLPTPSPRR